VTLFVLDHNQPIRRLPFWCWCPTYRITLFDIYHASVSLQRNAEISLSAENLLRYFASTIIEIKQNYQENGYVGEVRGDFDDENGYF
jgi:hypothetical protein